MARRSFRDRFFTPPVARAITSPLGLLLAGAGAAVGLIAGNIPLAIGLAVAAWGGRVLAAVPRDPRPVRIDPFTLGDPWKRMVQDALQAQARFTEAIHGAHQGPLRERMEEIGQRIATGVEEAWRVGRTGQALVEARRRIDVAGAQRELAKQSDAGSASAGSAQELTLRSLQAQLASAERLDTTIAGARDQLRLTTARLDEAVARAAELSVRAGDVHDLEGLGDAVDTLVQDLEALRLGLEELDQPRPGTGTG